MTNQEVCIALDEWTEVKEGLEACKKELEAVFCDEFVGMHLLQRWLKKKSAN